MRVRRTSRVVVAEVVVTLDTVPPAGAAELARVAAS